MIPVEVGQVRLAVESGATMQQICDAHATEVVFGCRAAQCGACLVEVLAGAENLSPVAEDEQAILDLLAGSADCRLACQLTVLGPVAIKVAC